MKDNFKAIIEALQIKVEESDQKLVEAVGILDTMMKYSFFVIHSHVHKI